MAGAKVILYNDKKEVLLQKRDHNPEILFPGYWGLLGGAIEEGESPEEGLRREIKEEIELTMDKLTFFKKVKINYKGKEHLVYFYLAKLNKPLKEIILHEGRRLKFFNEKEFKKIKIIPDNKKVMLEFWKRSNKA